MQFSSSRNHNNQRRLSRINNRIKNITRILLPWAALTVIVFFLLNCALAFFSIERYRSSELKIKTKQEELAVDEEDEDEEEEISNFIVTMGSPSVDDDEEVISKSTAEMTLNGRTMMSVSSTRLPPSYNGRNSLFLFSKSQPIPPSFSLDMSTQENYGVENKSFFGPFRDIRSGLDFAYHGNYSKSRQEFQDTIIEKFLDGTVIHDNTNGLVCKTPTEPWIVFTAGVMGAGKSHTMKQVASKGRFPLQSYVIVDPDEIRSHFPEYHLYAAHDPERAGQLTHKEAGYICEIVTAAALQRGNNVLVDGSLKDYEWYEEYFERLHEEYTLLRIAIVHITAPRASVIERAKNRAKDTGRVVPPDTLRLSLKQVPISVSKLASKVDFFCEIDNSPNLNEVKLVTESITWDSFRDNWAQTCPWVPGLQR